MLKFVSNKVFWILLIPIILIVTHLISPRDIYFFITLGIALYFVASFVFLYKLRYYHVIIGVFIHTIFLNAVIAFLIINKYYQVVDFQTIKRLIPFFLLSVLAFWTASIIGFVINKKMKKGPKKLVSIVIVSSLLMIIIGKFGWPYQFSLGGVVYSIGGFILGSKDANKNLRSFILLSAPMFSLFLIISLIDYLPHIYPLVLIIPIASIIGFYLKYLYLNHRHLAYYIVLFSAMFIYSLGYLGMLNWCEYVFSVEENSDVQKLSIKFITLDGKLYDINSISDKTYILYYWITSCGVCYNKMPDLENLTLKYINNDAVQIYAVISPLSITDTTCRDVIKELSSEYKINYAISLESTVDIKSNLNFNTFPHVLVIDKLGRVIYNGRFNNNPCVFVNNISNIIDDHLSDLMDR